MYSRGAIGKDFQQGRRCQRTAFCPISYLTTVGFPHALCSSSLNHLHLVHAWIPSGWSQLVGGLNKGSPRTFRKFQSITSKIILLRSLLQKKPPKNPFDDPQSYYFFSVLPKCIPLIYTFGILVVVFFPFVLCSLPALRQTTLSFGPRVIVSGDPRIGSMVGNEQASHPWTSPVFLNLLLKNNIFFSIFFGQKVFFWHSTLLGTLENLKNGFLAVFFD